MFKSKKKKNIKDLDNVLKSIENTNNIISDNLIKEQKAEKKHELKKIKIFLIISIFIFIIFSILYTIYYIKEGAEAPYAQLKSKNRNALIVKEVDDTLLENYLEKGKYTIVAFMASWCSHCRNEANALTQFMLEYDDVNFIVVSHDQDISILNTYLENNKNYNWFIIHDARTYNKKFNSSKCKYNSKNIFIK